MKEKNEKTGYAKGRALMGRWLKERSKEGEYV
jgi:hypothetical protein